MATTIRKKTLCSTCHKAAGILTCRGCEKDFCYRHVAEHRHELNNQMDKVAASHNQLQQTIIEQRAQSNGHPVMKKIDEWEQQSINIIHQAADNARKQVLTIIGTNTMQVKNDLIYLTQELNKAREEDDYVETELKQWTAKLDKLKTDLTAAQTIDFDQDSNSNALISKIFLNGISTDFFDRTIGDVHIIEDGKVVVHDQTNNVGAARSGGEYSLGQYRFRFKMEQWKSKKGFCCGIISKNMPDEALLHISTNNIRRSRYQCQEDYYGIDPNNEFLATLTNPEGYENWFNSYDDYKVDYTNGLVYFTNENYNTQKNDIVELWIDCDRQMIHLTNEQRNQRQTFNANINICPFPWQFFVILPCANERIRLCEEQCSALTKRRNKS